MPNFTVAVAKPWLGHVCPKDEAFGRDMLGKFLHVMEDEAKRPNAICLYTEGVKVLAGDSDIGLTLKLLAGLGVRIVACKSCLEYYNISDALPVGEAVGMDTVVRLLTQSDMVIHA